MDTTATMEKVAIVVRHAWTTGMKPKQVMVRNELINIYKRKEKKKKKKKIDFNNKIIPNIYLIFIKK